jgi:hypothetical protein
MLPVYIIMHDGRVSLRVRDAIPLFPLVWRCNPETGVFSISLAIIVKFHWFQNLILQKVDSNTYAAALHNIYIFLKPRSNSITNTDWRAQIDRSLQYGRPIQNPLSACPAHSLSQEIMASGKVANFFCGLTNKARNLTLLFIFTDGIEVCY